MEPELGVMTSQLIISNVTADDFGVYKCLGSNAKGEHFDYVTLHGRRPILVPFDELGCIMTDV